jgi:aminoglycoside N3'-acetyltransferase
MAWMNRRPVSRDRVVAQLIDLGVEAGGVLLVHTSFSKVGPVEGGPDGLVAALRAAIGPAGTLVMPSMSDDDDVPFDAERTPCLGMGVVADRFWRLPGVLRSDSPHSFAAVGPAAADVTAPHPLDVPHGLNSPAGRVYERGGQVLLSGVGHDANTTIHVAETMAGVRYRRPKYVMIRAGEQLARYDYQEIDHCCENFNLMDQWLDAAHQQRRGTVGHAEARLMRAREVVEIVVARIRGNETVFLHEYGVDAECDEARASLALTSAATPAAAADAGGGKGPV